MTSNPTGIIAAIAGISVTVGTTTPPVYYGDTIRESGDNAPMRLVLPSEVGSERRGVRFAVIGAGAVMTVIWNISDLLLWQRVPQGSGLDQVAGTLVSYAGAYVDALKNHQQVIANGRSTTLEAVDLDIGVFQFPVGSDTWYYGVETRYQVKEIVT